MSDKSDLRVSVAYLLGLPILGYSLDIGKEHTNLIDERLEKLIYSGQLDAKELDRYHISRAELLLNRFTFITTLYAINIIEVL